MRRIEDYAAAIGPVDKDIMSKARTRQDSLTKPRGSLGKLEDLSVQLCAIYGILTPAIGRKVVFTMAADHGVTEEGVSAYPSEVTRQMVLNFAGGGAAINVLARCASAEVRVVDMGVAADIDWPACVIDRKIAKGTRNMCKGPAMSAEQAATSMATGATLVAEAVADGATAIAVGDMGIGNTTAATAITSAVTGARVSEVTGRGTGVNDAVLSSKIRVIETALAVNSPDPSDGLDVLAKVGGFEIGGIAGAIIGGASEGIPVFLDGFVSSSAALVAAAIAPGCRDYLIASHISAEPGHRAVLNHLGATPLLDLGMRLGEGTGAALAFVIAESACRIMNEMATFEEASVSQSENR